MSGPQRQSLDCGTCPRDIPCRFSLVLRPSGIVHPAAYVPIRDLLIGSLLSAAVWPGPKGPGPAGRDKNADRPRASPMERRTAPDSIRIGAAVGRCPRSGVGLPIDVGPSCEAAWRRRPTLRARSRRRTGVCATRVGALGCVWQYPAVFADSTAVRTPITLEFFVIDRVSADRDLLRTVLVAMDAETFGAVAEFLVRASEHNSLARDLLHLASESLRDDARLCFDLRAAGAASTPTMDPWLTARLADVDLTEHVVRTAEYLVSNGRLPAAAVMVARRHLADARRTSPPYVVAGHLDALSALLVKAGELKTALATSAESVELWRRSNLRDGPCRSGLASALDGSGGRLDAVGRGAEALDVAQESVGLWRQLATRDPGAVLVWLRRWMV